MILRALYDLAQQEGLAEDLDFEQREVRFSLNISSDGSNASMVDMATSVQGPNKTKTILQKPNNKIPRQFKRSGTKPSTFFIVDNPTFVLGWAPPGSDSSEVQKALDRHARYVDEIARAKEAMPASSPEGHALNALLLFLSNPDRMRVADDAFRHLNSERDRTDFVSNWLVCVEPHAPSPLHLMPRIEAYWRQKRNEPPAKGKASGFSCLVTGSDCIPVDKHPPIRGVPGGNPAGTALISFNEKISESYGLERNNNGPISQPASEAIGNALNRLLSRNPAKPDGTPLAKRHVRLSSDTVALFWAEGNAEVSWFEQFTDEPEAVEAMLLSPHIGRKPILEDEASFHTLILSGAQGRSIVRAYGCRTTASVAQAVRRYLSQVRISRPFKGEGAYPLRVYLRSLAALGDEKNLPPSLAGALYMAILEDAPFPRMVLDAALRRARLEAPRMNDNDRRKKDEALEAFAARCGLIRAYFHRMTEPKEITVSLNPDNQESGYLLGRLLATLDKLQQDALGNVNATLVDRYYGSASTTPAAVFPTLIRRSQHHLGKLRREKPGIAINQEKLLQAICGSLDRFERTLSLEQQGLFALGFHHQRQDFFTKKDTPSSN